MSKDQPRRSTMESILTQGSQELVSQWEVIMRRFSDDCKKLNSQCRSRETELRADKQRNILPGKKGGRLPTVISPDFPREKLPLRRFVTGSTYDGTWDALGMSGHGVYTFPNGVIYEGDFFDGDFHGHGELRYPDGIKVIGVWSQGKLKQRTVVFEDGVVYKEHDWKYCTESDRRFATEYEQGMQPAGAEDAVMTASLPTKEIPEQCYDVCDGFYNPQTSTVFSYEDPSRIIRCPDKKLHEWILQNCRTNPEPAGPCPEFCAELPDPELKLPQPPSPPAMLSPSKSMESLNSIGRGQFGDTSSRLIQRADTRSTKTKGWTRRVIQFNPDSVENRK